MTVLVQPFPALDGATEAALRASIARFGVLVPVVHDQHGRTLDGHHRSRIADDLGVEYRIDVRHVADEDEAHEIALTLNTDRRHLRPDQRRPIVAALREEGHSFRAIGGALGISQTQAKKDADATLGVNGFTPERVEGQDGKSYPAAKPKAEPTERRGLRKDKTAPWDVTNERKRQIAEGQKRRLSDGLAQINGICRGLRDVDYRMVAAVSPDELATWAARAEELARTLRAIKTKLMEVSDAR